MNEIEQNLIDTAIAAIKAEKFPECQDWDKLLKFANYHDLQNLLAEALDRENNISEAEKQKLTNLRMVSLIKDANQETEIESIIKLFDQNKIKAVMLKGWYMKLLYPRSDLRSMADTDIFIKQQDEEKVHKLLKNLEYSVVAYGGKKDNVYRKDPVITIEMHKNLFMYEDNWNHFFNSPDSEMYVWKRLIKINEYENIYRMDDELFFVYMIAHTAKHLMDDGGIGVRAFLDIWIYLQRKPNLNFEIIFKDLDNLNLKQFAKSAIALADFWFDKKYASQEIEEFSDYILSCGVYGNSEFFVANNEVMRDGVKRGKWGYAFRRAFPNFESMKHRYPELEKKAWLLPFCYAKRLVYSLVHRKSSIKGELHSAGNIDFEKVNNIHKLYKNIGLKTE